MCPKSLLDVAEQDLFRMELVNPIDQRNDLIKVAALIGWLAVGQLHRCP